MNIKELIINWYHYDKIFLLCEDKTLPRTKDYICINKSCVSHDNKNLKSKSKNLILPGGGIFDKVMNYIYENKIDKRILHLSTLIVTNQMTRDDAVSLLKNSPYSSKDNLQEDIDFF